MERISKQHGRTGTEEADEGGRKGGEGRVENEWKMETMVVEIAEDKREETKKKKKAGCEGIGQGCRSKQRKRRKRNTSGQRKQ